jgi:membrane associated rhomboid family serine protease
MLPIQDVMPTRTLPRVVIGLVVAIVSGLALQLSLDTPAARGLLLAYGLIPAHSSPSTLLTYAFLHYGLADALVNALTLWVYGDNVEDRLGRARTLALFVLGAVAGGFVATQLAPDALTPVLGAAGGVGAIVGAHLRLFRQARVMMAVPDRHGFDLVEVPSPLVAMMWLVLTAVLAGMATAPLSGFATSTTAIPTTGLVLGAVLGQLLARPERLRCSWWNVPRQLPERRRTSRDTSASSASSASN